MTSTVLLDKNAIQPVNNQNFGEVNDPKIQTALAKLNPVPAGQLASARSGRRWTQYWPRRRTRSSYGYQSTPMFASNRIDFGAIVFSRRTERT